MSDFADSCHSASVADPVSDVKRATILSIDDDPNISSAIACRFRPYQIEVLRAFHGEQGIWMAATRKPDLVITDLCMPLTGGEDVVACLKRMPETRYIPIIVLTGQPNGHMRRQLRQMGVDGYLTKPIEFELLRTAVAMFINLESPIG